VGENRATPAEGGANPTLKPPAFRL
jgi:hypothetical protein